MSLTTTRRGTWQHEPTVADLLQFLESVPGFATVKVERLTDRPFDPVVTVVTVTWTEEDS